MFERLTKSELTGEVLRREIQNIVHTVQARSTPKAIVLFGSALTDSLTGGSDIDLLLLFETDELAERARRDVLTKGPVSEWPVDLLFIGIDAFKTKRALGGVYSVVQKQGKVLFPDSFQWEGL